MDEDSRLIRAMRAGSDEAIERFVRKYYPQIYAYCLRKLPSPADAEDVTQETFERFFRGFESYRHSGRAKTCMLFPAACVPIFTAARRTSLPLNYLSPPPHLSRRRICALI